MRDVLRWLPARQRFEYRMAALVWRYLLGLASASLVERCDPHYIYMCISVRSSSSLRSTEHGLLHVPFAIAPPPCRNVLSQWLAS